MNLRIDPEFRDKIPPLTEDEYRQLEENIVSDGEIYEPIVIWDGTIVDGHNRWKIHLDHPEIPFRTREMQFADKWAAFDWMYRKQLGRRNLTDEQRTYLLGKLYESRKMSKGGNRGNQYTANLANPEKQDLANPKKQDVIKTSAQIGKEVGVSHDTVEKAAVFANGVDAIRELSPTAADTILQGKANITKSAVREFTKQDTDTQIEIVDAIEKNKPVPKIPEKKKTTQAKQPEPVDEKPSQIEEPQKPKQYGRRENQQVYALIDSVYDSMLGKTPAPEYTVDDLVDEVRINAEDYIRVLRNTLAYRSTVLNTEENRTRVRDTVRNIQKEIERIGDLLK